MNKKKYPKGPQFNVRLTVHQMEDFRRYAWDHNLSIAQIIRDLLIQNKLISPVDKLFT